MEISVEFKGAYEDKVLTCQDCGGEFIFATGEQRFFARKELAPPKRCPDCRKKRRELMDKA
jgi:ssDNA-binding Zn-finger/Zn-ribbon topoisomerase 1